MKIRIAYQKPYQIGVSNPLYAEADEFMNWLEETFGKEFSSIQVRMEINNFIATQSHRNIISVNSSAGLHQLYKWGYLKLKDYKNKKRVYEIVKTPTTEQSSCV